VRNTTTKELIFETMVARAELGLRFGEAAAFMKCSQMDALNHAQRVSDLGFSLQWTPPQASTALAHAHQQPLPPTQQYQQPQLQWYNQQPPGFVDETPSTVNRMNRSSAKFRCNAVIKGGKRRCKNQDNSKSEKGWHFCASKHSDFYHRHLPDGGASHLTVTEGGQVLAEDQQGNLVPCTAQASQADGDTDPPTPTTATRTQDGGNNTPTPTPQQGGDNGAGVGGYGSAPSSPATPN